MKKENKKDITEVLTFLKERDRDWGHIKMLPKFKVLYDGWRQSELRRHVHSHLFYTKSWKRNWLPIDDWRRFRDYAMR